MIGREVRLGCCLSRIAFGLYIEEILGIFGDIRMEGRVICTVKYVVGLVLPAVEEILLSGMTFRLFFKMGDATEFK
jgi:hypothetical protein